MEKIFLVCPFTGYTFIAIQDGENIITRNPITGENITIVKTDNGYSIPFTAFDTPETVTIAQAAAMLFVSKQRMSALINSDTLKVYTLAGNNKYILKKDVLEYMGNRRNGRPRKCTE